MAQVPGAFWFHGMRARIKAMPQVSVTAENTSPIPTNPESPTNAHDGRHQHPQDDERAGRESDLALERPYPRGPFLDGETGGRPSQDSPLQDPDVSVPERLEPQSGRFRSAPGAAYDAHGFRWAEAPDVGIERTEGRRPQPRDSLRGDLRRLANIDGLAPSANEGGLELGRSARRETSGIGWSSLPSSWRQRKITV